MIAVGSAEPQPPARLNRQLASTASSPSQWALADLNHQLPIAVGTVGPLPIAAGTAGPQPADPRSQLARPDINQQSADRSYLQEKGEAWNSGLEFQHQGTSK